jgi:CBS domain-containing protein
MSSLQERLEQIARDLAKGVTPKRTTVRDLLNGLGVSRRGSYVNRRLRRALEKAGLETEPDFEGSFIDGSLKFVPLGSTSEKGTSTPMYQISGLQSANRKPVSVKPDNPVEKATTIMLNYDFSQLPVMTTDKEVKGIISWKSIGKRLVLGNKISAVRECMDPAQVISSEASLFDAINIIAEHDYVLIQAHDRTFCGIVTASDLSNQFRELAEPFLLIGEIENFIRRLVHGKFSKDELMEAKDPGDPCREIEGVADLTLGEYCRLLSNEKSWKRLRLSVDRCHFSAQLNRVREIRNDVMHFDPQGADPNTVLELQRFVGFLRELGRLGALRR